MNAKQLRDMLADVPDETIVRADFHVRLCSEVEDGDVLCGEVATARCEQRDDEEQEAPCVYLSVEEDASDEEEEEYEDEEW